MDDKIVIILGSIFCIAAGAFSLLGAVMNWEWFFRARKSATIDKIFGRTGARIFYGILGGILVAGGIWFMIYGLINGL